MKSTMPYRGVKSPARRQIWKDVFKRRPVPDFDSWRDTALALWRDAKYREERYSAIALTGDRQYRHFQTLATIPLYEELVVTGAWWDCRARSVRTPSSSMTASPQTSTTASSSFERQLAGPFVNTHGRIPRRFERTCAHTSSGSVR
jgi:DNA alkylation repair enzyme